MRFSVFLLLAFFAGAMAMPGAPPAYGHKAMATHTKPHHHATTPAAYHTKTKTITHTTSTTTATPTATPAPGLIGEIEKEIDSLVLELVDTIDDLLAALGLSPVVNTIDDLLKGLVGDVDSLLDEVDDVVDGLLIELGLSAVVDTVDDLEKALGLSPTDTIGTLLTELGLLK